MKSSISNNFRKFLLSLEKNSSVKCTKNDLSWQLFYDLFTIRNAQWRYKIRFQRGIDFTLSEIFQDLVAHYFKTCLSKKFEVFLEFKQKKIRPDILIRKNGENWAIIEIKTTIGYDRNLIKGRAYLKRLKKLSSEFKIPLKRVFYVFESSRNVSKEFSQKFENKSKTENIHKYIYPLFKESASPYYLENKRVKQERLNRKMDFRTYKTSEIKNLYKNYRLTPFKTIVKKIM